MVSLSCVNRLLRILWTIDLVHQPFPFFILSFRLLLKNFSCFPFFLKKKLEGDNYGTVPGSTLPLYVVAVVTLFFFGFFVFF